jgi:DNA mismatch repair protein MutS
MRLNEQTIADCNLRSTGSGKSIFDYFNYTFTAGGAITLEEMLLDKKDSVAEIEAMQSAIRYMADYPEHFVRLNNADIEYMRQYFRLNVDSDSILVNSIALRLGFTGNQTYQLLRGNVLRMIHFLRMIARKISGVKVEACPALIADQFRIIYRVLDDEYIKTLILANIEEAPSKTILAGDHYFRNHFRLTFNMLLEALFTLEAIWSVAYALKKHVLNFPVVARGAVFSVCDCFHPLLQNPVANDISGHADKNIMFLSGANMAGKSTYLRSIGAVVSLAHAGFPVPAVSATIPFYDDISVCITGNDNLLKGYSHFYNEILQIKRLMDSLISGATCFAIFDEVLNGTNVVDARACCHLLIQKLKPYPESLVLLSSHNLGLPGEALHDHVQYNHIAVLLNGDEPVFTYKVKSGKNHTSLGLRLFKQLGL